MLCPSCKKEFHPQPDQLITYRNDNFTNMGYRFSVQRCPSCQEFIIIREYGVTHWSNEFYMHEVTEVDIIYPPSEAPQKTLAPDIPKEFRDDFLEAFIGLKFSNKASAALSRRLLQKLLHQKLGIRKNNLSNEIDEFIKSAGAPSYLNNAIDAVRQIGNFAAHPMKHESSGEIVEVEAGEAEWLLEVLESLFDFAFVQPAKLSQRRQALNEKLKELGKPELKSD